MRSAISGRKKTTLYRRRLARQAREEIRQSQITRRSDPPDGRTDRDSGGVCDAPAYYSPPIALRPAAVILMRTTSTRHRHLAIRPPQTEPGQQVAAIAEPGQLFAGAGPLPASSSSARPTPLEAVCGTGTHPEVFS
jgi:hypothetical protein